MLGENTRVTIIAIDSTNICLSYLSFSSHSVVWRRPGGRCICHGLYYRRGTIRLGSLSILKCTLSMVTTLCSTVRYYFYLLNYAMLCFLCKHIWKGRAKQGYSVIITHKKLNILNKLNKIDGPFSQLIYVSIDECSLLKGWERIQSLSSTYSPSFFSFRYWKALFTKIVYEFAEFFIIIMSLNFLNMFLFIFQKLIIFYKNYV